MPKLRVGFVGACQSNFPGDMEAEVQRSISELNTLARELDFEFYPVLTPVYTGKEAEAARLYLEKSQVDFTLLQCSSFASGEIVANLVELPGALGLWAVPEPAVEGPLPLNSLCGVNMYAGILGHYFQDRNVRFKWFWGHADQEEFKNRLSLTIRVLRALKALRRGRIGLLGGVAPYFLDLKDDERQIEEIVGTRIVNLQEIGDVIARARKVERQHAGKVAHDMAAESCGGNADPAQIEKAARVCIALEQIVNEYDLQGLAVSCWPKFQDDYDNYAPCSTLGYLNEHGIVAACEGDALSAVSMLALGILSGEPPALMDLSAFDETDETVLLWHCGPGPRCWANKSGMRLNRHFQSWERGTVNDMILRPGPATIMRFTHKCRAMFFATAVGIDREKPSFDGSRGWFGDLHIHGEPVRAKDFINTIMVQRIPHHFPIASGHMHDELAELGAWLGLAILPAVPCANYIQNMTVPGI